MDEGVPGWCLFSTEIGACGIAWRGDALTGVQLPETDEARTRARMARQCPGVEEREPPAWVHEIVLRIQHLLQGAHDELSDVPLDMSNIPPFHQRVYAITRAIPPGATRTYGDIARELGEPGAARAVGQALGHNPFAPVVPCHRVLAAHNAGGGFSAEGGVATKLRMLQIERARFGAEPGLFDGL